MGDSSGGVRNHWTIPGDDAQLELDITTARSDASKRALHALVGDQVSLLRSERQGITGSLLGGVLFDVLKSDTIEPLDGSGDSSYNILQTRSNLRIYIPRVIVERDANWMRAEQYVLTVMTKYALLRDLLAYPTVVYVDVRLLLESEDLPPEYPTIPNAPRSILATGPVEYFASLLPNGKGLLIARLRQILGIEGQYLYDVKGYYTAKRDANKLDLQQCAHFVYDLLWVAAEQETSLPKRLEDQIVHYYTQGLVTSPPPTFSFIHRHHKLPSSTGDGLDYGTLLDTFILERFTVEQMLVYRRTDEEVQRDILWALRVLRAGVDWRIVPRTHTHQWLTGFYMAQRNRDLIIKFPLVEERIDDHELYDWRFKVYQNLPARFPLDRDRIALKSLPFVYVLRRTEDVYTTSSEEESIDSGTRITSSGRKMCQRKRNAMLSSRPLRSCDKTGQQHRGSARGSSKNAEVEEEDKEELQAMLTGEELSDEEVIGNEPTVGDVEEDEEENLTVAEDVGDQVHPLGVQASQRESVERTSSEEDVSQSEYEANDKVPSREIVQHIERARQQISTKFPFDLSSVDQFALDQNWRLVGTHALAAAALGKLVNRANLRAPHTRTSLESALVGIGAIRSSTPLGAEKGAQSMYLVAAGDPIPTPDVDPWERCSQLVQDEVQFEWRMSLFILAITHHFGLDFAATLKSLRDQNLESDLLLHANRELQDYTLYRPRTDVWYLHYMDGSVLVDTSYLSTATLIHRMADPQVQVIPFALDNSYVFAPRSSDNEGDVELDCSTTKMLRITNTSIPLLALNPTSSIPLPNVRYGAQGRYKLPDKARVSVDRELAPAFTAPRFERLENLFDFIAATLWTCLTAKADALRLYGPVAVTAMVVGDWKVYTEFIPPQLLDLFCDDANGIDPDNTRRLRNRIPMVSNATLTGDTGTTSPAPSSPPPPSPNQPKLHVQLLDQIRTFFDVEEYSVRNKATPTLFLHALDHEFIEQYCLLRDGALFDAPTYIRHLFRVGLQKDDVITQPDK